MLSEQIAEYVATLKFKPDNQSLQKADQWLRIVERKIQRFSNKIAKQNPIDSMFTANTTKLTAKLKRDEQK